MKKIEAIIRPNKVSEVCAVLEKVGHPGLMITEIEGHGKQKGVEQEARGKMYKVDFLPKAKIVVVVKDEDAVKIVKAIRDAAYTGKVGDGKIFISTIDWAVRIRTDEAGEAALS
jgi:nitrogen regulatory protein P-II 1